MFEFKLPDVGEGMHEAEILRWLIAPGDRVKVDQPMLEIQTDKAIVEIPAPVSGAVQEIRAPVGQLAHVGDVLITFDTEAVKAGATASRPAGQTAPASSLNRAEQQPATTAPVVATPAGAGRVRAAPAVRKRAIELDIDIRQVPPGSPDGRVLMKDVEAFAARKQPAAGTGQVEYTAAPQPATSNGHTQPQPAAAPPAQAPAEQVPATTPPKPVPVRDRAAQGGEERQALAGLRRRIAERMELSWRTIPHAATFQEIDGSGLVELRRQLLPAAERRGVKLTYLPLIVKAVVATLKQFPVFNASLDENSREIVYKRYYHIGLATATPDGLLVPVLRDADRLTLLEVAAEANRLSEGGRARSLKPNELSGSTFTISNVGSFGGSTGTAIINPPEAAILVTGKLQEKAVIVDGEIVKRSMMPVSMSFDHRLIDGAEAGAFMAALKELLENPGLLLLDAV